MIERRVVITGMGAFTALGQGVRAFYNALTSGRTGISELAWIPAARGKKRAAQIKTIPHKRLNRLFLIARHAVKEALEDARLDGQSLDGLGLYVATVAGESNALESRYHDFRNNKACARLRYAISFFPNHALADQIAYHFKIRGPRDVNTNACASGNIALSRAVSAIRLGQVDAALVCGAEQLKPTMYWGAERAGIMGKNIFPFHKDRDGTVLGDGAAVLMIEEKKRAEARGARIYAEVAGFGISCSDNPHEIIPQLDGLGVARSITSALKDAGLGADEIEYFNAHATGTINIDKSECAGIKLALGDHAYEIPVTSTKSFTGHLSSASAILEVIACVFAIDRGYIHPTANLDKVDPVLDLNFLPLKGLNRKVRCAISSSMGAGGANTSVVLTSPDFFYGRGEKGIDRKCFKEKGAQESVHATGAGVISPLGASVSDFWTLMLQGKTGVGRINEPWVKGFECRLGGRINDSDVFEIFPDLLQYKHCSRAAWLGMAAASLAVEYAGLKSDELKSPRTGVIVGTSLGGCSTWSRLLCEAFSRDPRLITPVVSVSHGHHLCATMIARKFGITGATYTLTGGAPAGLDAVGYARDLIRSSQLDVALVCGVDILDEELFRAMALLGALSPCSDNIGDYRVFDKFHNGKVLGEGAACLVLESGSHAAARGKEPLAAISAYSCNGSPCGAGRYDAEGENISRSMLDALRQVGVPEGEIAVYASANGLPVLDMAESKAISVVQKQTGKVAMRVTSIQPFTGDAGAASGLLSLVAAMLTVRGGKLPGVPNLSVPVVKGINFARSRSYESSFKHAIVNSVAPGGGSASVVCSKI